MIKVIQSYHGMMHLLLSFFSFYLFSFSDFRVIFNFDFLISDFQLRD